MQKTNIPDAANFIYSKEFRSIEQLDQLVSRVWC